MKIVYFEDTPIKYHAVQKVLLDMGYRETDIIRFENLEDGERYIDDNYKKEDIPFVLTDMYYPLTPDNNREAEAGEKLAKDMKETHSDIPVIVISSQPFSIPEAAACVWYNTNDLWEPKLQKAIKNACKEKRSIKHVKHEVTGTQIIDVYTGFEYQMRVSKDLNNPEIFRVDIKPDPDSKSYPAYLYPDIDYYNGSYNAAFRILSTFSIDAVQIETVEKTLRLAKDFMIHAQNEKLI